MKMHQIRIMALVLSSVLMTGCANRTAIQEQLIFPPDGNQPFLILEQTLGGQNTGPATNKGIKALLFGKQKTEDAILRPVALVEDMEGSIYIVDADAAKVFVYAVTETGYTQVTTFGSDELVAPSGIAIWNDEILVADAGSETICRFDDSYNFIDTLAVKELGRPGQIKVNPHTNDLFIVDTPNHYVLSINTEGVVTGHLRHKQTGDQLLGSPMAVDFTADGHIVVLDGLSRRVEIFRSDYNYQQGFGGYDRVPGSFSSPKGLAIASDGVVFISDAAFGNVQLFDLNGALLYFFGEIGKEAGEFLLPGSLILTSDDKLFVMDQFNSRIQIFQYLAQGG